MLFSIFIISNIWMIEEFFFVLFCSQEMVSSLSEVIGNKSGKKVLLYLLSPRDPAHFLPEIIQVLEKGDGNAHRYEKMSSFLLTCTAFGS